MRTLRLINPAFFGARNMTANAIISIDGRGYFDLIDDWLTRNQFGFIGWSGLLLTTTYLAIGDGLSGTTFVAFWYIHELHLLI